MSIVSRRGKLLWLRISLSLRGSSVWVILHLGPSHDTWVSEFRCLNGSLRTAPILSPVPIISADSIVSVPIESGGLLNGSRVLEDSFFPLLSPPSYLCERTLKNLLKLCFQTSEHDKPQPQHPYWKTPFCSVPFASGLRSSPRGSKWVFTRRQDPSRTSLDTTVT